ncbi:methyltransferase domain-containing protein [Nocardia sp. NBC_00508]|uniref:class I SAM-dependent methyltransferase n=1 Tax=Nocardia sp. NBC_00508 TaxID=2975992 RepID=UPI002E7FEEA6|nr:methyltransferase domain-containing protein [Nocardia sp. NBC_00508]WUD66915.1 methyltransferase domain-containing protein [Nocardia sp. NBC_00508]
MTPPSPDSVTSAATRRGYDAVAERYAVEIGDELKRKPLDRALLDTFVELASDGTIVDVGCGPGHVTAHLARRGAQVLGVDLSTAMCAVARRSAPLPFAVANMTRLPIRSRAVNGILCWYAVIHLDEAERAAAYVEFARVLRPGGHALVAFHTSDTDTRPGEAEHITEWWGRPVDLIFRFLDPAAETAALAAAGLTLAARLDRAPNPGTEHPSQRTYLLVRRLP